MGPRKWTCGGWPRGASGGWSTRATTARGLSARIVKLLNQGAVVALQETHWTAADAGTWAN
eukprot:15042357-Alexandrium_andersonii.AAC.1